MKISNIEKLKNTLADITGTSYYTSQTSCVIGKTSDKVIVISAYSVRKFEDEFNEDFDSIPEDRFCLEIKEGNDGDD
ncbi:hypothetical protein LE270_22515 [Salmonella enterica subsp. enterica serovar Hillegersberg]|uniref:hypothetical protein n=1 Tax=Salmonella enterica TaxID=28901 RepID=UPI001D08370F|nr:hypothetical protein [Salmonella enterica]MCB7134788.1 hypothetical protein [Salmonella enterica subsp. enterica serovar Hillegersberg]